MIWKSLLLCLLLRPLSLAAEPLATNVYGLLDLGMSTQAVVQKAGPPDAILPQPALLRPIAPHARTLIEVQRVLYIYDGQGKLFDKCLLFENGRLVQKYEHTC